MQCRRALRFNLQYRVGHSTASIPRNPRLHHLQSNHGFLYHGWHQSRKISGLASIPALLLPPVVFSGLLIALWTYKCVMMIVFQNKIIYMPSMPPFSRSEKVDDFASSCKPILWTEHFIKSLDDTKLALLRGGMDHSVDYARRPAQRHVVVLYLQGNASSLPPRLPYLSNVLKQLQTVNTEAQYTLVALSYRGFWKSRGRPNQKGIELDAQATLQWLEQQYAGLDNVKFVIWGQSIGAGVATTALATWLRRQTYRLENKSLHVSGLLLETPFTSLRDMLAALYPQKFLPYRYLGPFLKSTWDSEMGLSSIGQQLDTEASDCTGKSLRVMLLEAGNDELVPKGNARRLCRICDGFSSLSAEHQVVSGALHTNIMMKTEGKKQIVRFLRKVEAS